MDNNKKLINDIEIRYKLKADLKEEILNCSFLYISRHDLDIDAVYEILSDIRKEFDHGLGLDEIPF